MTWNFVYDDEVRARVRRIPSGAKDGVSKLLDRLRRDPMGSSSEVFAIHTGRAYRQANCLSRYGNFECYVVISFRINTSQHLINLEDVEFTQWQRRSERRAEK